MIRHLVIFGASGDLTSRYLLPAVAALAVAGKLPEGFVVRGVARDPWDDDRFRRHIAERLARHWPAGDAVARDEVVKMLRYRRGDITKPEEVRTALAGLDEPVVVYLALPPRFFAPAIESLVAVGLRPGSRLVVEKPFGEDLASAQRLNRLLHQAFAEQTVYRIDHFLHKQTVQNVVGLRFANRVFEPLWNTQHVERIDIRWDETVALEGRAGYYDTAGALRDMIQNHLLQLLALVAMEPPQLLTERDLRDRKVEALRAVRRFTPDEVRRHTRRARYTAGRIRGLDVPSYVDEPGVDGRRGTETYAEVTVFIDNWRWAGVPCRLRTGKALGEDRQEIAITFKPVPHLAFCEPREPMQNVLRLQLKPDRLSLDVNINGPGDPFALDAARLALDLADQDLPAYGRLLLDIFEGTPILSIRDDEIEESWRIVEPILSAWRMGEIPVQEYPAGSNGPAPRIEEIREPAEWEVRAP
ncbi:glucose-6-phosphate dehydrogenase [Candidatus Nitrospira bockiana]